MRPARFPRERGASARTGRCTPTDESRSHSTARTGYRSCSNSTARSRVSRSPARRGSVMRRACWSSSRATAGWDRRGLQLRPERQNYSRIRCKDPPARTRGDERDRRPGLSEPAFASARVACRFLWSVMPRRSLWPRPAGRSRFILTLRGRDDPKATTRHCSTRVSGVVWSRLALRPSLDRAHQSRNAET